MTVGKLSAFLEPLITQKQGLETGLGPRLRTSTEPTPSSAYSPELGRRQRSKTDLLHAKRYVAFSANPFRPDFGTTRLPSQMQSCLDDMMGERKNLGLCSFQEGSELMQEAEFHHVLERVQDERQDYPEDGPVGTLLTLLPALVVNPLILMPLYTSQNGLAVSAIILASMSYFAHAAAQALLNCLDELRTRVPVQETPDLARDYAFVAHHAFGGNLGRNVAVSVYALEFWCGVISNFVIVDSVCRPWLQADAAAARCLPILLSGAFTLILLYVPAGLFRKTQHMASLAVVVLFVTLIVAAVPVIRAEGFQLVRWIERPVSVERIFAEASSAVFGLGNAVIIPKMLTSWQDRQSERYALCGCAFGLSAVMYVAFGLVGAAVMRPVPPDEIFQLHGWTGAAGQFCFLLRVQLCLPLLASPPIHVLQDLLDIREQRVPRFILNVAFMLINVSLAWAAGGQIDLVMSFVGAVISSLLMAVFPHVMYLRVCQGNMTLAQRAKSVAFVCAGLILACGGTYASIMRVLGRAV